MQAEKNRPMISVIVPIYNVEEYLLECMESIERSVSDIEAEVLLIDDGSEDNSSFIAKEYAAGHNKFKYYHKDNGGLSDARNYGAAKAVGKYICFVDSDDIVSKDIYKNMLSAAEHHKADLTIVNVVRFNSQKIVSSKLHMKVFRNLDEQVSHISKCDNFIFDTTAWNKLILRSFWEENGFQYPVGWKFEDMPVSLAMHSKANKVAVVREAGYLWRKRDGHTKSITQEKDALENIKHRFKMLEDMFDYIYDELGNDKRLRDLLTYKAMTVDLPLYIDVMPSLTEEVYEEYRSLILDFYNRHSSQEILETLPIIRQQKYAYILDNNKDRLEQIIQFDKKEYSYLGYKKTDKGVLVDLPEDLFTVTCRNAMNDLEWSYPTEDCIDMKAGISDVKLYSFCYYSKMDLPADKDVFSAVLQNVATGETHRIGLEREKNELLNIKKSTLYDNYQGKRFDYDYDGAAFTLKIDLTDPELKELDPGRYVILLYYNEYAGSGNTVYRINNINIRDRISDLLLSGQKAAGRIEFDAMNQLVLVVEPGTGQSVQYRENCTEYENGCLRIAEKEGTCRLIKGDSLAVITSIEANGDTAILRARVYPQYTGDLKATLTFFDRLSERTVILSGIDACRCLKDSEYEFTIGLSEETISKNLYEGIRYPVLTLCGDDERYDIPVYADYTQSATAATEETLVYFRNDEYCRLILDVLSRTKQIANYNIYLRKSLYPELRKKPIDNKCILFESYWGAQYSCNPRALYEYIDKNHPEYTCVWSLKDERTPINGNGIRVRRFSPEYYHYLSVAKFLVNNVNFEDSYVKRKEQIEIQTMHGTPYKTLGLDVPGEFTNDNQKKKYIRRNNRWNYLVVQGLFSEKLAWRWFRFAKDYLRTGYPRTDGLINVTEEEIEVIRENLGLPKGKKAILYAPSFRTKNMEFNMPLDIELLRKNFGEDYILMMRLHHFDAEKYKVPEDGEFVFNMTGYSHIDDIFKVADILITDYSSVMFDFALTGRPEIFFAYDIEAYTEELRGSYFDITEEAPGPLVKTNKELVEAIRRASAGDWEEFDEKKKHFMQKYLTYENGASCKKIFEEVFEKERLRLEAKEKPLKRRIKRAIQRVVKALKK